jgi:hypothetical protein
MIYALMVDFHRDMQNATPLIDFLEEMHGRFAARTKALAYFENHDSPRATRVWRDRWAAQIEADAPTQAWWESRSGALMAALAKNLQASLIDLSAGYAGGSSLTCGLEWGSWWGELQATDMEQATVLDPGTRSRHPHAALAAAYLDLCSARQSWPETLTGHVYYHRNHHPGADPEDRILAYTRHTASGALLFLHNLDARTQRSSELDHAFLPWPVQAAATVWDSYAALGLQPGAVPPLQPGPDGRRRYHLLPLQSLVVRLTG